MKVKLSVLLIVIVLALFTQYTVSRVLNPEPDFSYQTWYANFERGELYTGEMNYVEYESMAYTPLYYILWFNIGGSPLPGQVVSVICTLLLAVFIYVVSRRYVKESLARLVPSLLFLLSPATIYWSTITRSDMMALLFVVVGVWMFLKGNLIWAATFFALAFFTKQSYIAAPLTVLLWYLKPFKREVIRMTLFYVLLLGGGLLVGQYLVSDGHFLRHIFLFPAQSGGLGVVDFGRAGWSLLITVGQNIGILFGAVIASYGILRRKRTFLETWFVVAFLVMLVSIGKPGSGTNYGLECLVVGSLLTGVVADKILRRRSNAEVMAIARGS